jgi:hypothetical protein
MSMEVPWFHGSIGSPWNRSLKWNGNLPLNLNGISMDCRCPTLIRFENSKCFVLKNQTSLAASRPLAGGQISSWGRVPGLSCPHGYGCTKKSCRRDEIDMRDKTFGDRVLECTKLCCTSGVAVSLEIRAEHRGPSSPLCRYARYSPCAGKWTTPTMAIQVPQCCNIGDIKVA